MLIRGWWPWPCTWCCNLKRRGRFASAGQSSFTAANAPEFILHHANVDKLWYEWQQQSPAHTNAFFSNRRNSQMPSAGGLRNQDVLDSTTMSIGPVEYVDATTNGQLEGGSGNEPLLGNEPICPPPWKENALRWFQGSLSAEELAAKEDLIDNFICSETGQRIPPIPAGMHRGGE